MVDQQVTISFDTILRGIELLVIPAVGWFLKNTWRELKGTIRNINTKVESTNTNLGDLAGEFDKFRLDAVDRLARLETHAERNGHPRP